MKVTNLKMKIQISKIKLSNLHFNTNLLSLITFPNQINYNFVKNKDALH